MKARHAMLIFFSVILTSLLFVMAIVASCSLHVYYPASTLLEPQRPELVLASPYSQEINVTIGPAAASALVVARASPYSQLVYNPDFYDAPDGWYRNETSRLSCYWIPSDAGASGGVYVIAANFTGTVTREAAYVYQEVEVPASRIINATLYVTLRGERRGPPFFYYDVKIIDAENHTTVWEASGRPPKGYTTLTWDVTGHLDPGRRYIIAVGMLVERSKEPALYIDNVYLTVETETAAISQPILAANVTSSNVLYVRVKLESIEADPSLNATIRLVNASGAESTPIRVVNGTPLEAETSWLEAGPAPQGYYSLLVRVNATKEIASISTLNLTLEYCTAPGGMGACVSYPVTLVLDPPPTRGAIGSSALIPWRVSGGGGW